MRYKEGYRADVVIPNPENYRDRATFESPRNFIKGVA